LEENDMVTRQARAVDLDEAAQLVEQLERDLARARAGGASLETLRAEVEQLRRALAADAPSDADVSHGLASVRTRLSDLGDELETDALLARLEMREAQEVLKLRTIRSPIAGIVADVRVDPGERVGEGEMLRIAQVDPLQVEVVVPVSLYGSVQVGGLGIVLPEPPFDEDREARVTVVDRVIDAASGTFGVRLELPNPERKIPAGLKCSVIFPSP